MDNQKEILVSVCTITYNHAPYIRQCLDGIIMQKTNFKFEIIIHDDCSTDGTTDIVREYAEKYPDLIIPIIQAENQYQNGNKRILASFVIPKASGKYIAYCEGDDYWIDPYKLQKQVDILESDPECSLVYTSYRRYIQDEDRFDNDFIVDKEGYVYENFFYPSRDVDPCTQTLTVCMRTEVLDNLPPIPKDAFHGDLYLWLTASLMGRFRVVKDVTSVYRILRNSGCHFNDPINGNKFNLSILKMKLAFMEMYPIKNPISINAIKFRYIYHLTQYSLLTNNFELYKDFHSEKKYFGKPKHRIKLFLYYFFREKHLFKCLSWTYRQIRKKDIQNI